jgi:prophage regulatory protein
MKILRMTAVKKKLSVSKATIYRWIKNGEFPTPLHLGPRTVGWSEASIDEWLASRPGAKG